MWRGTIKYIKLEECLKAIDSHVRQSLPVEEVGISDAYGRFLAEDVISNIDVPSCDIAHFDGYALRSSDVAQASPANPIRLKIKARLYPSTKELISLGPGEAAYITTGSPMPAGADGVLPVEASVVKGEYLEVRYRVRPGDHVIKAGSDVKQGEVILRRGHRLRGQDIALLALMGFTKVKVFSKPRVCIIPIGDELADESRVLKPGEVPCNHALMIGSFASRDGGVPLYFARVPDDPFLISEAVLRAASSSDLVLTIGGASRGEKDLVSTAISRIDGAKIVFHGMMTRPGRQTGFAVVDGKPLVILPGLVQSTIIGYQLIARSVMFKLMGLEVNDLTTKARMACDLRLPQPRGFKRVVFVELERNGNCYRAWPLIGESALLSIPVRAHGYVLFDEGLDGVEKDCVVDVHLLH
jgi:molybdenum cofactor synthesis domain-containing protein